MRLAGKGAVERACEQSGGHRYLFLPGLERTKPNYLVMPLHIAISSGHRRLCVRGLQMMWQWKPGCASPLRHGEAPSLCKGESPTRVLDVAELMRCRRALCLSALLRPVDARRHSHTFRVEVEQSHIGLFHDEDQERLWDDIDACCHCEAQRNISAAKLPRQACVTYGIPDSMRRRGRR